MRDNPYPLPSVGGVDTASWKYIRLYFVPLIFQVSLHLLEYQSPVPINKPVNVFAHDPFGINLSNNSQHFRPEMSVIVRSLSFPREREGLARKTPGDNNVVVSPVSPVSSGKFIINCPIIQSFYVPVVVSVRPIVF